MPEPRVTSAEDGAQLRSEWGVTFRTLIDPATGSERLWQRSVDLDEGAGANVGHLSAEDVLYVVNGTGVIQAGPDRARDELSPGRAVLVPPRVSARIINTGPGKMRLISVLSPPPFDEDGAFAWGSTAPITVIAEDDQEALPAGEDRFFKLLIQSEHLTQFVGFIRRSSAPFHTHTYEESIHIVKGRGVVHLEDRTEPIPAGTSVFLPPGIPHRLENLGPHLLKLVGVFSPPGSPASKQERP